MNLQRRRGFSVRNSLVSTRSSEHKTNKQTLRYFEKRNTWISPYNNLINKAILSCFGKTSGFVKNGTSAMFILVNA